MIPRSGHRRRRRRRSHTSACWPSSKSLAPYIACACHAPLGGPMCTTLLASALATGGFPCRWCHGRDGSDGGKSPDAGPFSLQTSSLTRHSALIPPCCTCLVTKHTHSHIEFPRRKCKYLFFARWCSFLCIYHVVTAM
jgi:hypothetical protein